MVYFTIFTFGTLSSFSFLLLLLLYRLIGRFDYWKKCNVKGPTPLPLFGNFKDVYLGKINIALLYKRFYDTYRDEPYVGIYQGKNPQLVLRDPHLIKDVFIKDFNYFSDRGIYTSHKKDPWALNLSNLESTKWRPLRKYFTPAFTHSKLKDMFYLLSECATKFAIYVIAIVEKGEPIECRQLCSMFTTSTIGACAFGLNSDFSITEINKLQKCGTELLNCTFMNFIRQVMREKFPQLFFLLEPIVRDKNTVFLMNILQETIENRSKSNFKRNDFVDILVDLRNHPEKLSEIEITDVLLASQAFIFFVAGYDTSAGTMSAVIYELTLNQQYQSKLREEINKVLEVDGKFNFDNIRTMKYLDKVYKETLRKYPSVPYTIRASTAPYTFPSTNLTISKHTHVIIPIWAIHRDPTIYPNPDVFDPERFSPENEKNRHPMNYAPFGHGPRNCIGSRFADYQVKLGVATLISKFKTEVCNKTCSSYVVHPWSLVPYAIEGLYVKFIKI